MHWWQWVLIVSFAVALVADRVTEKDAWNEFMDAGPRNTAAHGYALCKRIYHLESEHHRSRNDLTCAEIYKVLPEESE